MRRQKAQIAKGVVTTLKPYIGLFEDEDEEDEGVIGFEKFTLLSDKEKAKKFWREGIVPILSNVLGFF